MLSVDQCNLLGKATQQLHANPEQAIHLLQRKFDDEGPYYCAKSLGCLVEQSGEELAIAFMTYYNDHVCVRY
jgi:hypothetical protein